MNHNLAHREQILKKRNTVVKESCEEGGRGGK